MNPAKMACLLAIVPDDKTVKPRHREVNHWLVKQLGGEAEITAGVDRVEQNVVCKLPSICSTWTTEAEP